MSSKSDRRRQNRVQSGWNSGPARRPGGAGGSQKNNADNAENEQQQQQQQQLQTSTAAGQGQFVFDNRVKEDLAREAEFLGKPVTIESDGVYDLSVGAGKVEARVQLERNFIRAGGESQRILADLMRLPWQVRTGLDRDGKPYPEPRQTCWYGRPYTYSHVKWEATDDVWPQVLIELKTRLANKLGVEFNSVMCNLYRDGKDKIGWHSDDEPSLGRHPVIASLSFGETRNFLLRRRDNRVQTVKPLIGDPVTVPLQSGDLLVMRGSLQEDWLHSVPPEYHDKTVRVNLTFRVIEHEPSEKLEIRPGVGNENRVVELSSRPGRLSAQLCCYRSPLASEAGPDLVAEATEALNRLQWRDAGSCDLAELSIAASQSISPSFSRLAVALAKVTGNDRLKFGPYQHIAAVRFNHGSQHLPWRSGPASVDEDTGEETFITVLAMGDPEVVLQRPLEIEKQLSSPARGHLRSGRVFLRPGDAATMLYGFGADWRCQLGRSGRPEPHAPAVFLFLTPRQRGIDNLLAGLAI